jgi:hypothetical protein
MQSIVDTTMQAWGFRRWVVQNDDPISHVL